MSERDISARLTALGLAATAASLDDIVAMATKKRWSPVQLLEHVLSLEERDRSRRGLDRRLKRSRLERFKPMADFDWNWPTKIDRSLVESALRLDFIEDARNIVLVAPQGLGKTMMAQNIVHQAVIHGHGALFISAARPRRAGVRTRPRAPIQVLRPRRTARHRRDRLPRLRCSKRRPAVSGHHPPLREEERRPHDQSRLPRLANHLSQRHLRHRPHRPRRSPRGRHRHRGRKLPRS